LLAATLFARFVGNSRLRTRHRRILDLVGNRHPAAPGAVVVDHPSATAYCLPGFRSRIVISSGAIAALSDDELSAVLAHERAHVHGRHHLVLLPFRALSSALPGSRVANAIFGEVQELVEMAADDRALRGVERGSLARALCRLTTIDLPAGALGASATATGDRVNRALAPRGHGGRIAFAAAIATAIVFSAPCITLLATVGAK
jgi:beta-lactamase regulating signal transducer with metallopeptidase domain